MMRVSLMNLGDAPRVFHNRLNRAVVVPVGRVVIADLAALEIQNLKFPSRGETVLVGEPEITEIPLEMRGVVDLLAVVEFESYERALQKFLAVVPPGSMTESRPSRMQIRRFLQTMVEDYIAQQTSPKTKTVHDDEDPKVLERELERQKGGAEQSPVHPIDQVKRDKIATETMVPPVVPRPRPLQVRGSATSPAAKPSRAKARAGKRS